MQELFEIYGTWQWQQVVMWRIGGLLIWLAIKKEMEPSLLLPMGFGAILVNLPLSGAVTQVLSTGTEVGPLDVLFDAGIANELFPLLLFVGIGAMIDFTPLLSNPKLMIFGAAAQFGIFFTLGAATLMGFELKDAASIAVIGAADGPTSIFVANFLESNYLGAIIVAAYSYMALVPIIQPPVIRLVTTKKRAPDPHAICRKASQQNGKNPVPHHYYHGGWAVCAAQCGAGWLFDVRQPHPGMWCAGQPIRNRTKGTGKPHYPAAGADGGIQNAGRVFFESADPDDSGAGAGGLCVRYHRRRAGGQGI